MASYEARLSRDGDGSWIASAVAFPNCWSRGSTSDEAVSKLRDEIRYRIELCPCSGVDDDFVKVDLHVVDRGSRGAPVDPGWRTEHAGSSIADVRAAAPATTPGARQVSGIGERSLPASLSGVAGCPSTPSRRADATRASSPAPDPGEAPTPPKRDGGWRRWDD